MLARFVDVETVACLFLLASQILVVSGAIAPELVDDLSSNDSSPPDRALRPFFWRLMNFEFGCGVAPWLPRSAWLVRVALHACFVAPCCSSLTSLRSTGVVRHGLLPERAGGRPRSSNRHACRDDLGLEHPAEQGRGPVVQDFAEVIVEDRGPAESA
jgi:hypothetical protein